MESNEPAAVAGRFLRAFSEADFEAMRAMLAEELVAYVTNADGGIDEVEGRDEYLRRIEEMGLPAARSSVALTQAPVLVGSDRTLVMVEVRSQRGDRALHTSRRTFCESPADGSPNRRWWTQSLPRAPVSGLREKTLASREERQPRLASSGHGRVCYQLSYHSHARSRTQARPSAHGVPCRRSRKERLMC
jgi:hypothetical protein